MKGISVLYQRYRFGTVLLAILSAVWFSACSRSLDFSVSRFHIEQVSWDSIYVSVQFIHSPALGTTEVVSPDAVVFTVFNAEFDTLYVGDHSAIALPDQALKDRERLLVEACGFFRTSSSCEQRIISASPKQVFAEYEVVYPKDPPAYESGEIEMTSSLHRQQFGEDTWELIRSPSGKELSVRAYVENAPDDYVGIPISRSKTSFVLSRYDGFKDFRYQIQSSLMDADSAIVLFDLYALTTDQPVMVDRKQFVLRPKSKEERNSEVQLLVERSAAQILEKLSGRLGSRRAYVFINDWSFEPLAKVYLAEYELHWQEALRDGWSDLTGRLYVKTDGSDPSFIFLRGSERATKIWSEKIGAESVDIEPLFSERERKARSGK